MAAATPNSDAGTLTKVIGASSVGTLIEWYDFYIFGVLATTLSANFFPKGNETAALLSTLATFATGFVVRPFGALVFGRLGDLVGRKTTFLLTLLLMGGSTFAVGLLPTYAQAGVLAPALLVLMRLVQGLALGGEYGGAATYVAEHAPVGKRGFYTSFIQTTATLGLFVALGVILAARQSMPSAQFEESGWRIPFLLSSVLVVFSYFIRRSMNESPLFASLKAEGKISTNPLRESFVNPENRRLVLLALFGATAGQGVVWYTSQFHALYFMQTNLKVSNEVSSQVLAIGLLLGTPFFIVFGALSDKVGRKKIMLTGCALAAVLYIPLFKLLEALAGPVTKVGEKMVAQNPNVVPMSLVIAVLLLFVTMVYGPIAAFLVELFPTRIRYTSMSLPYHLGNGVFGGVVPLIAKGIDAQSGNPYLGLAYPITVAVITVVVGGFLIREKDEGAAATA